MIVNVDIKSLLDDYNISYRERGKNVGRGDINLEVCPFCGNSDAHCAIKLSEPIWQCWVCGEKGFITKLLKEIDEFKGKNLNLLMQPYIEKGVDIQAEYIKSKANGLQQPGRGIIKLPQGILHDLPIPHRNYLIERGFDPDFLLKKYKLMSVYNVGDDKYRFRIIVPTFIQGRMVAFLGASVVRVKDIVKYVNCTEEEAILPINSCLYNYDSVKEGGTAVIVEGVTDVWRMGDGFIGTFRKYMTSEQISLLLKKKLRRVVVMRDPDAQKEGIILANDLVGLFPEVETADLVHTDPGGLSYEEAQEIRALYF